MLLDLKRILLVAVVALQTAAAQAQTDTVRDRLDRARVDGSALAAQAAQLGCQSQFRAVVDSDLMQRPAEFPLHAYGVFHVIDQRGTAQGAFASVVQEPQMDLEKVRSREGLDRAVASLRAKLANAFEGGLSDRSKQQWKQFAAAAQEFHACIIKATFQGVDLKLGDAPAQRAEPARSESPVPVEFLQPEPGEQVLACQSWDPSTTPSKSPNFFLRFSDKKLDNGDRSGSMIFFRTYRTNEPSFLVSKGEFGWAYADEKNKDAGRTLVFTSLTTPMLPVSFRSAGFTGPDTMQSRHEGTDIVKTGAVGQGGAQSLYSWRATIKDGLRRGTIEVGIQQSVYLKMNGKWERDNTFSAGSKTVRFVCSSN